MKRWAYRQLKPDSPPGPPSWAEIIVGLLAVGLMIALVVGK